MLEQIKRLWPRLEWSMECEMFGGDVLEWRYEATTNEGVNLTVFRYERSVGKPQRVEFYSACKGCEIEGYGVTLDEAMEHARQNVAKLFAEEL